jgi:hypothetical protein
LVHARVCHAKAGLANILATDLLVCVSLGMGAESQSLFGLEPTSALPKSWHHHIHWLLLGWLAKA